ncbi:MAG: hypothetical protein RLZZ127_2206, partial [Planctomycetota bacterium]
HRLTPGRGYLAPPGVEHRLLRVEGPRHHFRFAVIDLDGLVAGKKALIADARALARSGRLVVADGEGLAPAIHLLTAGAVRGGPHRREVLQAAVAALAAAAVDWAVAPRPADLAPGHRAVAEVRRRIAADPGRAWTLADLAAGTGVSGKHLCTIFRAEVGTTPLHHVMDVRLARVAEALRRDGPGIGALAEAYGFASSQHLSRRFAERYGQPPSRWRIRQDVSAPDPDARSAGIALRQV